MRLLYPTLIALAALCGASLAQDGPTGIAFVEAPEMSSGVCTGGTPEKAFGCAKQKCIDGGGTAQDCLRVKWCYPAGWSVDVFVQHREGLHWHEIFCGLDSKETGMAVAKAVCDKTVRPYLLECQPVLVYDPDGAATEIAPEETAN